MPKYKATAYIRLSYTDDHSSESDSVSNQRKLIENFVEHNPDIEVVSEKIDDGYSGIIFERPQVQKLIELVRANQIDCVIIKDFPASGETALKPATLSSACSRCSIPASFPSATILTAANSRVTPAAWT